MDDIPQEIVQEAIEGDERFALIHLGIAVENEINTSESLKIIFRESFDEAAEALRKLAIIDPTLTNDIRLLQNVINRAASMRKWLLDRVERAARIERSVRDDEIDIAGHDPGN